MIDNRHIRLLVLTGILAAGGSYMSETDSHSLQTPGSSTMRLTFNGGRPRAFTFVQLVFESKWIVIGTVTTTEKAGALPIMLFVTRSFPVGVAQQIRIIDRSSQSEMEPASFYVGEKTVLFLANLSQGEGELLGSGDVGKWPRQSPDWLFSRGHVQPASDVERIVELLIKIDARKTYDERLSALLNELIPEGTLGKIAAAEYAADYQRWEGVQSLGEGGLPTVRWLVATTFLRRGKPEDPAIDYAVLQLLTTAPTSVAIPYLIDRLNDPDAAVRDTAFSSLRTVTVPYTQETFNYSSSAPPEQRTSAIQRWRRWWAQNQSARLRDEVPKTLSELEALHVLRRTSADWFLRLVSNRNAGYDANAPVEQRREAIVRWQEWWQQFSQQLK